MKLKASAAPRRPRPEVIALLACPDAKVEDDVYAQRQRARGYVPHQRFDGVVPVVVAFVQVVFAKICAEQY